MWGQCEGARLLPTERIWIDFLEFISRVWSYLKWEESYPFGLHPRDPSLLRTEAKARWEMLEEDRSSEEENEVTAFEQRHDLAQGFTGKDTLPVVRLIREGNQMWIVSPHRMVLRPLTEVLEQLSMIGDVIASWIASCDEPRAHDAIERWHAPPGTGREWRSRARSSPQHG